MIFKKSGGKAKVGPVTHRAICNRTAICRVKVASAVVSGVVSGSPFHEIIQAPRIVVAYSSSISTRTIAPLS